MTLRQKRIKLMAEEFKGRKRTFEGYPAYIKSAIGLSYMEISGAAAGVGDSAGNLYTYDSPTSTAAINNIDKDGWCSFAINNTSSSTTYRVIQTAVNDELKTDTNYYLYVEFAEKENAGLSISNSWSGGGINQQFAQNASTSGFIKTRSSFDGCNCMLYTSVSVPANTSGRIKYRLAVYETQKNIFYKRGLYLIPLTLGVDTMTVYTNRQLKESDIAMIDIERKTATINGTEDITAVQNWDGVPTSLGSATVTADTEVQPPRLYGRYYSKVKGE